MPSKKYFLIALTVLTAMPVTFQTGSRLLAQPPGVPPSLANDKSAPLPDDPATVMAVVGQTPILWGDIQPKVDGQIAKVLKQQKVQIPKEQLAPARKNLARGALRQAIQTKMMSESFLLEQVGTQSAEKRQEVSTMMSSRARQMFFENELKGLQKKYGTEDLTELDALMRETGTSLRARQREFTDMMLGHMYMKSKINQDPHVTIAEINASYASNLDSYRHNAKARWEQLSVMFSNYGSRDEAYKAIVNMGREAFYGGNLQAVARDKSEEPYASDGGVHDWTAEGSLKSKPIEKQIFSIPLNKMSEIIEDEDGLHIVRVLERKAAGVLPLADLQEDIRKKIKQEKIVAAQEQMLREMNRKVPVWSMYPEDMPGAKPLRPNSVATRPASKSTF